MTTEITDFIQSQGRALSLADIDRLIVDLPALRTIRQNPELHIPVWQTSFNSCVVEEQVVSRAGRGVGGEAAFALLYFQRD